MNKRYWKQSFTSSKDVLFNQMGKLGSNRMLMTITDSFAMMIPILIAGSLAIILRVFLFAEGGAIASSVLGWIGLAHTNALNGGVELLTGLGEATPAMGPIVQVGGQFFFNPTFEIVNGLPVYQLISKIGGDILVPLWFVSLEYITLYVVMSISFNIARYHKSNSPILTMLVGVGAFLIISGGFAWPAPVTMNSNRLLAGMLSAFIFASAFEWLTKNPKMIIKMPHGVPPAVANSFAKLFPTIITLFIALGVNGIFAAVAYFSGLGAYSLAQGISDAIQAPFLTIINDKGAQFGIGIFYVTLVSFLWFFGLHGTNVLGGIFAPIVTAGTIQNEIARGPGGDPDNITIMSGSTFDGFIFFGGAGCTLALLIATMVLSKKRAERDITVFGGGPAIFNINEPIIFGYPIVLNFRLFVPFVLNQMVLFTITYLAIITFKWVPATNVVIPWTSPIGIGAFLATQDWTGIVLAFVNLAIAILIYAPFVILANKIAKSNGEELIDPYAKFRRTKVNLNG